MSDVTRILAQVNEGDPSAANELFRLVYAELRGLAASRLAQERPGQTLQASALVHEAYLRMVQPPVAAAPADGDNQPSRESSACRTAMPFDSRRHFFAAAAEAMRRVLVDRARRTRRLKRGGHSVRQHDAKLQELPAPASCDAATLLSVHAALDQLMAEDPSAAELVKLHMFLGMTLVEAAATLGISRATAFRQWAYARAWLKVALGSAVVEEENSDSQ